MVELYLDKSEMQYGLRRRAVGVGLTGISPGANDIIYEVAILDVTRWWAEAAKLTACEMSAVSFSTPGNQMSVTMAAPAGNTCFYDAAGGWPSRIIRNMFRNYAHFFIIIRAVQEVVHISGQQIAVIGKVAHNETWGTCNLCHLSWGAAGPDAMRDTVVVMSRMYYGDFSGLSNADVLAIHRKHLRHPMITPAELLPYEAFRFTGRQPGGAQILAADTNIYNCAPGSVGYGETLQIHGGLQWSDVREQIWMPR